ncbi:hypothetical protein C7N43_07535 [Sphingobacteriales bacterium UPWRP_1]|nr:hypothetical protein C7N43_07535 [Sphingobacteriales bacterium UPWRP_1]
MFYPFNFMNLIKPRVLGVKTLATIFLTNSDLCATLANLAVKEKNRKDRYVIRKDRYDLN